MRNACPKLLPAMGHHCTPEPNMSARALTDLTEEERLFRDSVFAFARERVAPKSQQMDHEAHLDPALIPELFELGVMGVEIPGEYSGSGSNLFNLMLAVEALARVDASVS